LRSLLVEDLVFSVQSEPQARSIVGRGLGRTQFLRRLDHLLEHVDVLAFDPVAVSSVGIWCKARLNFSYRHRRHRMVIDGTMRARFAFVGPRIAHFELFHDVRLMGVFYDLGRPKALSA
jgi:hypothetical protein